MSRKDIEPDPDREIDLLREVEQFRVSDPGTVRTYSDFLASFARFRDVERQFRGSAQDAARPGARMRFRG